jgi:hypothetical protein
MRLDNIMYFSPMTARGFFEKLEKASNPLIELSTSYYKKTVDEIFEKEGYELYFDRAESRKRGYRLYRSIKIAEDNPESNTTLQFNPEELVT